MAIRSFLIQGLFFILFPFLVFAQKKSINDIATLNNLGTEILHQRDTASTYQKMIEHSYKALRYFQKSKNWSAIVDIKMHLAEFHFHIQEYSEFENNIEELKTLLHTKGISDSLYNESEKILVWYYQIKEDYGTAEKLKKKVYHYDLLHSNKITTSIAASNLGFFYNNYLHDPQRAIEYFHKAIKLITQSKEKNERTRAVFYSNLGRSLYKTNQHELAKTAFYQSLQIASPIVKDDWATMAKWWSYQNLSAIHLENNKLDSCLFYHNKAMVILEKENKSYWDDYETFGTIGKFYLKKGDSSKAIKYYKKGWARAKKQEDVFRPVNAVTALAQVLSEQGFHQEALDSLQIGLRLLSPDFQDDDVLANPPATSFAHKKSALELVQTRAVIFFSHYKKTNDIKLLEAALNNYQLADEIIYLIRQDYSGDASKYFLAKKVLSSYENGIHIAQQLYKLNQDEKYLEIAFRFAEQNKSILLLESIKDNAAKGFGQLPDSILNLEKQFRLDLAFLDKRIYNEKKAASPDLIKIKTHEEERFSIKESYNDLIDQIENQYPTYFELKYQPATASIKQIQQYLPNEHSNLLEYFVGENYIFLFCIEKNKTHLYTIEKPKALLNSFNQLRSIYTKAPNSEQHEKQLQQYNQLAHSFYQLLLEEALQKSSGNQLIIVLDDFLNYLPFEILRTQNTTSKNYRLAEQPYLLKDYAVSYSFSASLLLKTKDLSYPYKHEYAGFAPQFNNTKTQASRTCSEEELYSLQCSEQEVSNISKLFDDKTYIGSTATKEQFNEVIDQFNIIHLATHACIDENNPNFSRIYFSNDYLSNYDLINMRIQSNLVVLSACNTNVGPLMKGDGVSSISKGFVLAGVPTILTSLWSVDDCSTSDIMLRFYQSFKEKNKSARALQDAKMMYLQDADHVFSHPYYWATFILSGQDVITKKENSLAYWQWLISGFIIFSLLLLLLKKVKA